MYCHDADVDADAAAVADDDAGAVAGAVISSLLLSLSCIYDRHRLSLLLS